MQKDNFPAQRRSELNYLDGREEKADATEIFPQD
jgi:hypothetical protein